MRFYKPNPAYLEYLYNLDNNIIKIRNMIGIVIRLNEMIYFLPVDSVSSTDYDGNNELRKTKPTILRMIDSKTGNYLGNVYFQICFLLLLYSYSIKHIP